MTRIDQGCHRLYALSVTRQQQTRKICPQWLVSVGVDDRSRNVIDIPLESSHKLPAKVHIL